MYYSPAVFYTSQISFVEFYLAVFAMFLGSSLAICSSRNLWNGSPFWTSLRQCNISLFAWRFHGSHARCKFPQICCLSRGKGPRLSLLPGTPRLGGSPVLTTERSVWSRRQDGGARRTERSSQTRKWSLSLKRIYDNGSLHWIFKYQSTQKVLEVLILLWMH